MHPLTNIVCGTADLSGTLREVHSHLTDSLDRLFLKGVALKTAGDANDLALFGPFVARATLEVALTAIMARFDAFRVLAIRKAQASSNYDLTSRNPLAFNWKNDVQGEEKPKDWEQRPSTKELQRALLCRHFNDIFWQEAFTFMLDAVPFNRGAVWMATLKKLSPEIFTVRLRSDADRLYSELSKGVHHEFVIPMTAQCMTQSQ